jgi:hypothetical protein
MCLQMVKYQVKLAMHESAEHIHTYVQLREHACTHIESEIYVY